MPDLPEPVSRRLIQQNKDRNHTFGRVYYDDGRTGPVLIAAHG